MVMKGAEKCGRATKRSLRIVYSRSAPPSPLFINLDFIVNIASSPFTTIWFKSFRMGITHIVQFGFKSSVSPDVVKDVRHR